jgi:hypothetical protein
MRSGVEQSMAAVRGLGAVDEVRLQAQKGLAPQRRPRVNAHIHLPPNFSAFESVKQAVELAAAQGVGVLGVSNYYDYEVYGDFVMLAGRKRIFSIFGLEIIALIDELVKAGVKINDPGNPGKMYICGKGINHFVDMTEEAKRLLGIIRHNDSTRMAQMVEKLEAIFRQRGVATGLNESAVKDMIVRRHDCPRERVYLQERHVCQAFQEALFAKVPAAQRLEKLTSVLGVAPKSVDDPVKVQNDIRACLMKAGKPAFVPETFVSFEQAYQLILELGGIPCYPTLADGTKPICQYEDPIDKLIENIKGNRIPMAEFIPIRNTPEVLSRYVKAMRAAGLPVLAGTEHNTLDLLPIEPTCLNGQPVPEDIKEIFWEGTCVAAAHQFLCFNGVCGFVDHQGNPNPDYKSDEQRIQAFAKLGAAVIERYYQTQR